MASIKVSISKYRLHKGSGQAFVQIKGYRHYLGAHNSPKSKEWYSRFVAELAVNPQPTTIPMVPIEGITVAELAVAYLNHAEGYYRKNGVSTRRVGIISKILAMLGELYGRMPARDLGPLALRTIQQTLILRKIGRNFINDQVRVIVCMFKWGASLELITETVYRSLATVPSLRAGRSDAKESWHVGPVPTDSSCTGRNEFCKSQSDVVFAGGFPAGNMLIGFDLFFDIHSPDVHAISGDAFDAREGGLFDGVGDGGWLPEKRRRLLGVGSIVDHIAGEIGLPCANGPVEDGVVDVGVGREVDAAQGNPAAVDAVNFVPDEIDGQIAHVFLFGFGLVLAFPLVLGIGGKVDSILIQITIIPRYDSYIIFGNKTTLI